MAREIENNKIELIGVFESEFTFSHEAFGERFYIADFKIERISDNVDIVPVMIPDRLIDVKDNLIGKVMKVSGQLRSYNKHEDGKSKLLISVFANNIEESEKYDNNKIFLDGYICKLPFYRKTPLGREITDVLLAVNRPYGKSDYIPCIAWGRNARYASCLDVGCRIMIYGRIQSRGYNKKLSETEYERRTAYEVSISRMEEVKNE